ncbi:unnamed protein product [Mytilus coruscus]|uniref:Uncharacterized protein n=1 Tax=Mytilus coruscus TaxID=42192 RepID=A0A6J8B483_MYTCO|nr:unnamed protein product [Mytilus coruscus]
MIKFDGSQSDIKVTKVFKSVINVTDTNQTLSECKTLDLQKMIDKYSDIFVQNGHLGKCSLLQHKIEVHEGTRPTRQRAYKVGPKQKDVLESMTEDMLENDIFEELLWGAPSFLIAKKNKGIVLWSTLELIKQTFNHCGRSLRKSRDCFIILFFLAGPTVSFFLVRD